jgi:hypothetical protein
VLQCRRAIGLAENRQRLARRDRLLGQVADIEDAQGQEISLQSLLRRDLQYPVAGYMMQMQRSQQNVERAGGANRFEIQADQLIGSDARFFQAFGIQNDGHADAFVQIFADVAERSLDHVDVDLLPQLVVHGGINGLPLPKFGWLLAGARNCNSVLRRLVRRYPPRRCAAHHQSAHKDSRLLSRAHDFAPDKIRFAPQATKSPANAD